QRIANVSLEIRTLRACSERSTPCSDGRTREALTAVRVLLGIGPPAEFLRMTTPPDFLPRRSQRAREAHRELRTGPVADSREAAPSGWPTNRERGVHLPSLAHLAPA